MPYRGRRETAQNEKNVVNTEKPRSQSKHMPWENRFREGMWHVAKTYSFKEHFLEEKISFRSNVG